MFSLLLTRYIDSGCLTLPVFYTRPSVCQLHIMEFYENHIKDYKAKKGLMNVWHMLGTG